MTGGATVTPAPGGFLGAYLSPIAALLDDPAVIEIAVNADGGVWVERAGDAAMGRVMVDADQTSPLQVDADRLARQIVGAAGLSLGPAQPLASARMAWRDDLVRAQIVAPPAIEATAIALRKTTGRRFDLCDFGFLHGTGHDADAARAARLAACLDHAAHGDTAAALRAAVAQKLNVLISGGTSSAKTSLARAMIAEMPESDRLITIEDAVELAPEQPNTLQLIAERRADSPRAPARLLEAALRLRPDRIILGELRGAEAATFLEAINTGHGGSMTTLHAESPERAVERLATLVSEARPATPYTIIERTIRGAVDLIVQLGRVDGRRGVLSIAPPREP